MEHPLRGLITGAPISHKVRSLKKLAPVISPVTDVP